MEKKFHPQLGYGSNLVHCKYLQSKYSENCSKTFVNCASISIWGVDEYKKCSGSTLELKTQLKVVLLAAEISAVCIQPAIFRIEFSLENFTKKEFGLKYD